MIDYHDLTHTYSHSGRRYLSATQLIGMFCTEFDSERMADEHAYRHGQTAQHWLERWGYIRDRALERGMRIHGLRETITNNRGQEVVKGKPMAVRNLGLYPVNRSLQELPDGVYTEIIVWSHQWCIAGRIDRLILDSVWPAPALYRSSPFPIKRLSHIQDYKTNRFIRMRGYPLNHDGSQRRMMNYPLSHLEDCDMVHYELQTSLYQFMLEEHGFSPGSQEIIHFPQVPSCAPQDATEPPPRYYPCSYRQNDVVSMLTYLKERHVI